MMISWNGNIFCIADSFLGESMWWSSVVHYWPFVRGIHRSPVNSPHKGPVMQTFNISFVVNLNKLLNKQSSCWLLKMLYYAMQCQDNREPPSLKPKASLRRELISAVICQYWSTGRSILGCAIPPTLQKQPRFQVTQPIPLNVTQTFMLQSQIYIKIKNDFWHT